MPDALSRRQARHFVVELAIEDYNRASVAMAAIVRWPPFVTFAVCAVTALEQAVRCGSP
jgi:hypothetical protein